jgi:hypothetical protein
MFFHTEFKLFDFLHIFILIVLSFCSNNYIVNKTNSLEP